MNIVTGVAAPVADSSTRSKWFWLGLAAAAGVAIAALPTPSGLTRPAQLVLAITAFTVLLWMFRVMNNGVASVLMMALMIPAGIRPQLAFSGFASPQFWLLLTVLFYGFAMQRTGLAQRLSYYILSLFPSTYSGILGAFFVIGLVLALGIPSMTVRTAIMAPLAWALVQSLGIAPRSRSAAVIMLTAVEMAVVPGCAFLYGSLYGPVVESVFQTKNLDLSWMAYAKVMTVPTLVLCGLLIAVNQIVLKPESTLNSSPRFAREGLKGLGPIKRAEILTGGVVALSIVYWATDRIHHLPSFFIGMLALVVFTLAGIVRDEDIATGVSWTLLLFLGGILSLGNIIQEYKLTDWLATLFVPAVQRLTFSTVAVVLVMALGMFAFRFLDPSGFIAIAVLFLPVSDITGAAGIPPLVLVAPLVMAGVPFWVSYQNIWVVMCEGITANQAFSGRQRLRLANAYAAICLVTLALAVGFWKLIGVL
ncbi:MAG TPA: SLC13 family permease [Blastocatellia bacterium]|nr:SLC13 family permease [Blastocatellia bacterium]